MDKTVSVVIPNKGDLILLAVTVRSALEELRNIPGGGEIIVVDQSDDEYYKLVKNHKLWSSLYKEVKIIRQDFPCIFTALETAAKEARGRYLLRLDSHMLCGRNMVHDMVDFADNKDDKLAYTHAPLSFVTQHDQNAVHDVFLDGSDIDMLCRWRGRYKKPSKMTYKGVPWLVDREKFLVDLGGCGALAQHQLSPFGDPYLGIKPWLLGFENWAIPCRPGIHIGPLTDIARYEKVSHKGACGKHSSVVTALVTGYVFGGEKGARKYGFNLVRGIGGNTKTLREQVDNTSMDLIAELAKDDREWFLTRCTMEMDELLVKKPWETS